MLTRTSGISWIDGLEVSESPQFADTVCAVLAAVGIALGAVVAVRGGRPAPRIGLVVPGALVGIVSVAAMLSSTTHVHSHGTEGEAAAHDHETEEAGSGAAATPMTTMRPPRATPHTHDDDAAAAGDAAHTHDEGTTPRRTTTPPTRPRGRGRGIRRRRSTSPACPT